MITTNNLIWKLLSYLFDSSPVCVKLFVKLKRNKLVEVTPHEIHFDGFDLNQSHSRDLHILNRSSEVIRVDIVPPQTSSFQIDYMVHSTKRTLGTIV